MWKVILKALGPLVSSKRFQSAVVAAVVWGAAKIGWNLSTELASGLVAPFLLLIPGYTVSDLGKSKPLPPVAL